MKHQITKMKFQAPNAKSQINTKSQIPRLRQGFGGQANSKPFENWSFGHWYLFVICILLFGILGIKIRSMKFQIPNPKSQINTKSQIPRLRQGFGGQANSKPFGIWQLGFWSLFVIWSLLFGISKADAAVIQKPPANLGLVGYWSFNEGTTTIATDYSGNKNYGELKNGPTWTNGKLGKALSFDGSDDYVNIGNSSQFYNTNNTAFTIAGWFKNSAATVETRLASFLRGAGSTGISVGRNLNSGSTNKFGGAYRDAANVFQKVETTTTITSAGTWYHFAYVISGANAYIYLNGLQEASVSDVNSANTFTSGAFPADIGTFDRGASNVWNGLIDEVRIYNRALSAGEVSALYQSGAAKFTNPSNLGLVGYWSFNEGTTTIATDYSGNKNYGELKNGPVWSNGKLGKALSFDGSDDYVAIPYADSLASVKVSLSYWLKEGARPDILDTLVSRKYDGTGIPYLSDLRGTNNSQITFGTFTGVNHFVTSNTVTVPNKWYHVVGTFDGSAYRIYINGVLDNTLVDSTALYVGTSLGLTIGDLDLNGTASRFFNGFIDEVRIYNRALSASEVAGLYKSGAAKINAPQNNFLANGLVGMWSFDGSAMGTTSARDLTAYGNTGWLTNGPKKVIGKIGQALSFDGSNDYVDIGLSKPAALNLTGNMTISLWFNTKSVAAGTKGLVADWDSTANFSQFGLEINRTAGKLDSLANGSDVAVTSNTALSINRWYHAVLTRSGSTGSWTHTIYLNGSPDGSVTTAQNPDTQRGSAIGREGNWNAGYFPGLIDEVRIYNRALSAGEVKQLYDVGR